MLIKANCDNVTLAVEKALSRGEKEIVFEKGEYHFYQENAQERNSYISNHDNDGVKRVGINLENLSGITIDGAGSKFIFHGIMLPISVTNSTDVVLRNFSIDFPVAAYVHSTVLEAGEDFCDVKLWENTPYRMENGTPFFAVDGGYEFPYGNALEFNPKLECVEYGTNERDYFTHSNAEELSIGVLRIKQDFPVTPKEGNYMFFRLGKRFAPAIFIDKSLEITVKEVTVHHCFGMALLAQLSGNINIHAVKVIPSSGRFVSAYADAVHFVECRGDIVVENCHFEKQMDDALNCHGIYVRVEEVCGKTALLHLMHRQALGIPVFSAGDNVEYVDFETMQSYGENRIVKAQMQDASTIRVTFEKEASVKCGDYLENISHSPNLTVRNCYFGKNRARGLLITTRGKVLVENNTFERTGTAIRISGDCNFWFESGVVKDVTISGNTFIDLNANSRWGQAVIDVTPQNVKAYRAVHKNIRIINNTFRTFDEPLLWAKSAEGIVFKNNEIEKTTTFPPKGLLADAVTLIGCHDCNIENK